MIYRGRETLVGSRYFNRLKRTQVEEFQLPWRLLKSSTHRDDSFIANGVATEMEFTKTMLLAKEDG